MHMFIGDPLRDPVWQFISVLVSIILGVGGFVLPYFLSTGKSEAEKLSAAKALIQRDRSLGCAGSLSLFILLIATSYLLYHLLLRMFFLNRSLDQNTLLVTSFVVIVCITLFFISFRHTQLLLVLVCHFCIVTFVFALIIVSLKLGAFHYQDFTSFKQFVAHYLSFINNIPLQLKAIPVDVIIKDRTAAQTLFFYEYGISLFFFLFLYGLYKRRETLLASAFASQSAESRQIILQNLERVDKEVTIQLKQLDAEKKRVSYAHDLSATLADTVQPEADATTRATLIRHFFPDFLQLGTKNTEDIILPHLKNTEASPAPEVSSKKPGRISNYFARALGYSPLSTPRPGSSQSVTSFAGPNPSLGNESQLLPFGIVVPNLLNLDIITACEQARNSGMRVVIKGEDTHLDLKPGTVVYQNPGPGRYLDGVIKDMNENILDISVLLSKRKSFETQILPVIVEEIDSKASSHDDDLHPISQETQILPDTVEEIDSMAPSHGEDLHPTSQESQQKKLSKKQKKHLSKDKTDSKAPSHDEDLHPISQESQQKKLSKKQKKHLGKNKADSKVQSRDEDLHPISQESQQKKLSKKQKKHLSKNKAEAFPDSHFSTPLEPVHADPFQDREEFLPLALPEQHGATFAIDANEIAPDVDDIPTDVLEIESLGDWDDFVDSEDFPVHKSPDTIINEADQIAPEIYGRRPSKPILDFGDEDLLPPIEDPPGPSSPLSTSRAGSSRGARPSKQVQPAARKRITRSAPKTRPVARGRRLIMPSPASRSARKPRRHRTGRTS